MTKILVTGSAGYIGCVLVSKRLSENYDVKALANFYRGAGFSPIC